VVTTISTEEAEKHLDEGTTIIDVRTEGEFADGHIPGAFNVPVNIDTPQGMQANADFVAVMNASFAKETKLVLHCRAGARSAQAATQLTEAGYTDLLDMTAGFVGKKDTFGQVIPGWQTEGREVTTESEEGQTYAALRKAVKL
jgi:rhodanese-related sulfurtransferase